MNNILLALLPPTSITYNGARLTTNIWTSEERHLRRKLSFFKTVSSPSSQLQSLKCTALANQVRVSLSGGMNPASPRVRRATRPLGRMVSHVMLPLFKPMRNQPSGGNCRALRTEDDTFTKKQKPISSFKKTGIIQRHCVTHCSKMAI